MGKGRYRTIPKHQGCMGKAGRVLRDVLNTYGISQNKLAIAIGVRSSVVYRWFHESIDPTVNTLVKMVVALKLLDIDAAREFVQLIWVRFWRMRVR